MRKNNSPAENYPKKGAIGHSNNICESSRTRDSNEVTQRELCEIVHHVTVKLNVINKSLIPEIVNLSTKLNNQV